MGIVTDALVGGLGDGMRTYAGQMAANYGQEERYAEQERLKRMDIDAKRELKMEELKARKDELMMRLAEAREKNRSQFESRPDLYGANAAPTDRAKFEREDTTYSRTDDSEYSDAVSRKTAPLVETKKKSFDQAGYDAAEEKRVSTNIRRKAMVDHPGQYDNLERGRGRGLVNDAIEQGDNIGAAERSMAVEGKDRFAVQGNTVVDKASGDAKATAVGESVVNKNNRPPAGKSGGGSARLDTEPGKNARADVAVAERTLRDAEKSLSKLRESPAINRENIARQESYVNQLRQDLASARRRLAPGGTSQGDNATKPSGGAKKDFSKLW